jgi:hypothetical protein
MATSAITGRSFLPVFQRFFMATQALPMIGPFKMKPGFRPVAGGTLNLLVSLLQCAFVQDIFTLLVEMVAILAGPSLFDMKVMGKGYGRPLFPGPALR